MERWNIEAGDLRQSVIIQLKAVGSNDSRGHPSRTWSDSVSDVRAKIETPTGRKLELARQLVPTATHLVEMRYRVLDIENNRLAYFAVKQTTLSGAANSSTTSVSVTSASSLRVNTVVKVDSEQMRITAIANTTLTVTRAVNGTSAANHSSGASVLKQRVFNIGHIEDVEERHVKMILTCTEAEGTLTGT